MRNQLVYKLAETPIVVTGELFFDSHDMSWPHDGEEQVAAFNATFPGGLDLAKLLFGIKREEIWTKMLMSEFRRSVWRLQWLGITRIEVSMRGNEDINRLVVQSMDLRCQCLAGVNISRGNFTWADLSRANFRNSNLSNASFLDANLMGVDFRGADLTRADMTGAALYGANLDGAILDGAIMPYGWRDTIAIDPWWENISTYDTEAHRYSGQTPFEGIKYE